MKQITKRACSLILCFSFLISSSLAAPPSESATLADTLLENIYGASYTQDEFWVMSQVSYAVLLEDTAQVLSDEATQAYLDISIAKAFETQLAGDLAKIILSLRALGYNPSSVVTAEGETLDCVAKLRTLSATDAYTLPYVILALQSCGESGLPTEALLDLQFSDGSFGYSYGGADYADPDATAYAITALSSFYGSDATITDAIDRALAIIPTFLGESGSVFSWGVENPNSTAELITAASALGLDVETTASLYSEHGTTMLDGLLSLRNPTESGFLYAGAENELATKQSFRALVAQKRLVNVYDFSAYPYALATATPNGPFDDVLNSHWSASYINDLAAKGILLGTSEAIFAPEAALTRAQAVAILYRAASVKDFIIPASFSDVASGAWYEQPIAWASENGIALGYHGNFSPNDAITREDFFVLLDRFIDTFNYELSPSVAPISFADGASIASYASDAVVSLQTAGLIVGTGDAMVSPKDAMTRAGAAKMLSLLLAA